jgi:hypothetical protein
LPAPGSEALISESGGGPRSSQVINYYFPVEVRLVGQPGPEHMRQIADCIYDELLDAFQGVIV